MALTRYHGNGSSSICLAVLYVVVGIVGSMWLISSCVPIGSGIGATLGFLSGFTFYFVTCTLGSVLCCWCYLAWYQYVIGAITFFCPVTTSCVPPPRPLYLSVDCFSAYFGMMLNISARLRNYV